MEKPSGKQPIKNLRDAYKLAGFRAQAKIDSDELAHEAEAALSGFGEAARVLVEVTRFTAARRS